MKIAIVGPSECGKDLSAGWMREHCTTTYTRSTSEVIAPHAAARLGLSVEEAFARRHQDRALWRAIGDELRVHDPAYLARRCLADGEILVGVRSRTEMEAVIAEGMVDLTIWLERDVPEDPTLEFGSELADVVIENHGSKQQLYGRLRRLSYALGILKFPR